MIWNPERWHPRALEFIEGWTSVDWRRRTGFVSQEGREFRVQLRRGVTPESVVEVEHFEYAKRFGQSWLSKPNWKLQDA